MSNFGGKQCIPNQNDLFLTIKVYGNKCGFVFQQLYSPSENPNIHR